MSQQLQFKISSALKNIIGRDLINDDFIAVFELVKNSYDAHAKRVDIYFENIYSKDAKIIIKDNGKGMSYDDLVNKWLFVAYSAKKEGTEEDSFDYRDKIKVKRAYAGAKGIGRFSCDRLGSHLFLETKKDEPNAKTETLYTDWDKFEGDLKDEFINVSVLHETLNGDAVAYNHGTSLEISVLHSDWNRPKFLALKEALAKLINPNLQKNEDTFQILLHVHEELAEDEEQKNYKDKVNGEIQNLIFDTLNLKTTKIVSEIRDNEIITELLEGGKSIYKIHEKNNHQFISNIYYSIYFLNRSAKINFRKKMWVHAVEYGHIYMYKNGLRIYPYGERGEDPLKMDNRKTQGHNRYLGTREVIGYIEIKGENDELSETSSRGDGLIKTKAYFELVEWFYVTLRRLEKYGINITDWGNDLSPDDYINLSNEERVNALHSLIERLTKSKDIISYELAPEILDILNEKQKDSAPAILKSIKEEINSDSFDKDLVIQKIGRAEIEIESLKRIKENVEDEAFQHLIKNEELEQKIEVEKDQNKYLLATRDVSDEVLDIIHAIKIYSQDMSNTIVSIFDLLDKENIKNTALNIELEFLKFNIDKSKLLSEFITKADLKDLKEKTWIDIPQYIKEFIENYNIGLQSKFRILCDNCSTAFRSQVSILDISIVLSNLISNSKKANATEMKISFALDPSKRLIVDISDNGLGLSKEFKNSPDNIFKLGITNKSGGSGIGLHTLKKIMQEHLHGDILYLGEGLPPQGATFRLLIK
ncbi:MAG: ATP-binding protein [Bacteroidales bacterium]|nr:ATP-binding protein [Bacteroidales bacterium]